ncbi:hypothetical protein G5C51_37375 [Streptomyces sp. A7024]|uniref:Uncharacterized protein n=1 Tax=Streptomyces coryli TaxID=1128680 RepID=A0A6G4UBD3_9ACTN|nr:DUF5993 family protein [Streptomyces coryli]NGN69545.1 hypothetical protein [Streptomyces coryli]
MDTLIFAALLGTLYVIVRRKSRSTVLIAWWVSVAATSALLAHHITSGLGLGLNY